MFEECKMCMINCNGFKCAKIIPTNSNVSKEWLSYRNRFPSICRCRWWITILGGMCKCSGGVANQKLFKIRFREHEDAYMHSKVFRVNFVRLYEFISNFALLHLEVGLVQG